MKSQRPIIFTLGVPGQIYLAEALSREFDCPVIGLTTFARMDERITDDNRTIFQEVRSFPKYYLEERKNLEKMTTTDRDQEFRDLEESLGIENNNMLVHHDRALRKGKNFKKSRIYQHCTLKFIKNLLDDVDPLFALDGVAAYMQLALRHACNHKDIPYLLTAGGRIDGQFNALHSNGLLMGMQEIFDRMQSDQSFALDKEIEEKADQWFDDFVNRPERPASAAVNSNLKFNPKRTIENLSRTLHPDNLSPEENVILVDRHIGYEETPVSLLKRGATSKLRRIQQMFFNPFNSTPDLNTPFMYLPLHYTPETSDMFFGYAYDHHAGFIAQLAKHIPSNCQLYVKDHTSMLGMRPNAFYKEINSIYNVNVICPSVDTFSLIKNAQATISVAGTAGWEAYLLGRPVIVLGDVFYNFLPSNLHIPLERDTEQKIRAYLKNFKSSESERRNAFRSFYAAGYKGTNDVDLMVKMEGLAPDSRLKENARLFAAAVKDCMNDWGHTIPGTYEPMPAAKKATV